MSRIFAFVTCTRVDWECDEDGLPVGDPIEQDGWIDWRWSARELFESRNDVNPMVSFNLSDLTSDFGAVRESAEEEVRNALAFLDGGWEDNGDGTFYALDNYRPYDEGASYGYALHFVRKFLGPKGWTEEAWHPVRDGGMTL